MKKTAVAAAAMDQNGLAPLMLKYQPTAEPLSESLVMISRSQIVGLRNPSEKGSFFSEYLHELLGIARELAGYLCATITHPVKFSRTIRAFGRYLYRHMK